MTSYHQAFESPIGIIEVTANQDAVLSVYFKDHALNSQSNDVTNLAVSQLTEYFDGKRFDFDLPLDPQGTAFQQSVWRSLQTIEYAKTCSYLNIAEALDNPKGVRAVGAANGKNPISVIIPCHRVIGKNGTLTGYAGGIDRKAWLLQHEQQHSSLDYSQEP